jgi:hypothetical protein
LLSTYICISLIGKPIAKRKSQGRAKIMSKTYLGSTSYTTETNEPASPSRFEFIREAVPSSPLTSEIRYVSDRDHIDRVELGSFGGKRFLIDKTRFNV